MTKAKQRVEQHLIDQDGERLLRELLPRPWVMRPYRPDYGLDYAIETFRTDDNGDPVSGHETLGEHFFVQLKSKEAPEPKAFNIHARYNVEKERERLEDKITGVVDTYRLSIETSELVTVERMGVGVPVLLVLADLSRKSCSFVCLNDYIDKILIPRHDDYRAKGSRTIHIPVANQVAGRDGNLALRWYAKRAKFLAAFQRFSYQYNELRHEEHGDWRALAQYFATRISHYDFWRDYSMWKWVYVLGAALNKFVETGQPDLMKIDHEQVAKSGLDLGDYLQKMDVFELWRQLAHMSRVYEDICREWFLPTHIGYASGVIERRKAGQDPPIE